MIDIEHDLLEGCPHFQVVDEATRILAVRSNGTVCVMVRGADGWFTEPGKYFVSNGDIVRWTEIHGEVDSWR